MRILKVFAFILLFVGTARSESFDFYVLSLSWSPTWCAEQHGRRDSQQCARARPFGFVVHGLWPQYQSGFPQFCKRQRIPRSLVETMLDIMPSTGLVYHQWDKHGTCTGLTPQDYFTTTRQAYNRVNIPPDFTSPEAAKMISIADMEAAFITVNPAIPMDAISITCRKNHISEVRICLSNSLEFQSCPQLEKTTCSADKAYMPAMR